MRTRTSSADRFCRVLLLVIFVAAFASPLVASTNQIGSAQLSPIACAAGGIPDATCYQVVISDCPDTPSPFVAEIKVNEPGLPSAKGTVFFTVGGGGDAYYDNNASFMGDPRCPESNCGAMVVQAVNSVGYRTVQTLFQNANNPSSEPVGWLTGPSADGPRSLACRYATLVHTVWVELLGRESQSPVCATGNSGGGQAIAYAITQYGMGNELGPGPLFTMVEPTSGPPTGRIDHGCMGLAAPAPIVTCPAGAAISENYGVLDAEEYLDPAYPQEYCSIDIESNGEETHSTFHHDSVLSDDFPQPSYQTVVRALFGSADGSAAVPLGLEWYDAITSTKSQACIQGAPHELPGFFGGATTIVSDVVNLCR